MGFGHVLNVYPGCRRQFFSPAPNPFAQRFGKPWIVEDPDVVGVQKTRHARRVTGPWQGASDDDPVVTGM
jgi:hypothetical protein